MNRMESNWGPNETSNPGDIKYVDFLAFKHFVNKNLRSGATKITHHQAYLNLQTRARSALDELFGGGADLKLDNVVKFVCESVENVVPSTWMGLMSAYADDPPPESEEDKKRQTEISDIMKIVFPLGNDGGADDEGLGESDDEANEVVGEVDEDLVAVSLPVRSQYMWNLVLDIMREDIDISSALDNDGRMHLGATAQSAAVAGHEQAFWTILFKRIIEHRSEGRIWSGDVMKTLADSAFKTSSQSQGGHHEELQDCQPVVDELSAGSGKRPSPRKRVRGKQLSGQGRSSTSRRACTI